MIRTSKTTRNENWIEALGMKREKIPLLIIGNNPIEITQFYNILVTNASKNYLADVCFDVRDSFNRIAKQRPNVILIDDNLMVGDINKLVKVLKSNAKTKDIKLIVLKSNNWNYNVVDNVDDYILKNTIASGMLDRIIEKNLHKHQHQYA
jgi:PleD family two-component response regulator